MTHDTDYDSDPRLEYLDADYLTDEDYNLDDLIDDSDWQLQQDANE